MGIEYTQPDKASPYRADRLMRIFAIFREHIQKYARRYFEVTEGKNPPKQGIFVELEGISFCMERVTFTEWWSFKFGMFSSLIESQRSKSLN